MTNDDASLEATAARAIRLLDLTSLNDNDGEATVAALCKRATLAPQPVAAVCIWPRLVTHARGLLQDSGARLAAVANFPPGGDDIPSPLRLPASLVIKGADPLDRAHAHPT